MHQNHLNNFLNIFYPQRNYIIFQQKLLYPDIPLKFLRYKIKTILFISSAKVARIAAGKTDMKDNSMFGSHQKQIRNTKKVKKGGTNKANLFQIF